MSDPETPSLPDPGSPRDVADTQPIRMCIAALGGEGGGVLTAWLVAVARAEGWPVQSTSVPGVAQRTGATTYYIEIVPRAWDGPAQPVLALTPTAGFVDVVVATELLEAGRAIEQGFVSPDRTTIIASSHRSFTIEEKSAMADERIEPDRILKAIQALSARSILVDFSRLAREANAVPSSVVLGAIAGAGLLPISRETYEETMRASGIAVEANLRGFAAAFDYVTGQGPPVAADAPKAATEAPTTGAGDKVGHEFPAEIREMLDHAIPRLTSYQNAGYAERYLNAVRRILESEKTAGASGRGYPVTREAARYLALMMSYEDIVRVAALKTAPERWQALGKANQMEHSDTLRVTEYLKPGVEEFASMMPPFLGRRLVAAARRRGKLDAYNIGMGIRTTSAWGFAMMRLLAAMRIWRPFTYRYALETAAIDAWVDLVVAATLIDPGFGAEVVECARIRKGYGSTHRRGTVNFEALMTRIVAPAVAAGRSDKDPLAEFRKLALSDPEGDAMLKELDRRYPGSQRDDF